MVREDLICFRISGKKLKESSGRSHLRSTLTEVVFLVRKLTSAEGRKRRRSKRKGRRSRKRKRRRRRKEEER